MLKNRTLKRIIAVLLAGAGAASSAVPVMADGSHRSYFTYTLKMPGEKTKTYSSRKKLDLTSVKASKSNAVIKLRSAFWGGRKMKLSDMKIACMFMSPDGHIISLTDGGSSLKISARLIKAIAGTEKNPSIVLMPKDAYSSGGATLSAGLKDKKFRKNIYSSDSFYNIKMGKYGTSKAGFSLTSSGFAINGEKRKDNTYAWWVAEYRPIKGTWTATDFIIAPKYPYKVGSTAYRLVVQRKNGNVTGMKIAGTMILTGDSGEVWAPDPTASLPAGWKRGKMLKYSYSPNAPRNLKAYSSGKGAITIRWTPDGTADGYEIECSRHSDFSLARTQKYTGTNVSSCTAASLRSGEKYYVRARSRRSVNGRTYYSSWKKISRKVSVI